MSILQILGIIFCLFAMTFIMVGFIKLRKTTPGNAAKFFIAAIAFMIIGITDIILDQTGILQNNNENEQYQTISESQIQTTSENHIITKAETNKNIDYVCGYIIGFIIGIFTCFVIILNKER